MARKKKVESPFCYYCVNKDNVLSEIKNPSEVIKHYRTKYRKNSLKDHKEPIYIHVHKNEDIKCKDGSYINLQRNTKICLTEYRANTQIAQLEKNSFAFYVSEDNKIKISIPNSLDLIYFNNKNEFSLNEIEEAFLAYITDNYSKNKTIKINVIKYKPNNISYESWEHCLEDEINIAYQIINAIRNAGIENQIQNVVEKRIALNVPDYNLYIKDEYFNFQVMYYVAGPQFSSVPR